MKRRHYLYIFLFLIIVVALLYHYAFIMFVAEKKAGLSEQAFTTENQKLGDIPKILGTNTGPVSRSCIVAENRHFNTELICSADENYASVGGLNPQRLYKFASKIVSSLNKNGWKVDNVAELNNSDDKLLDVAYHKNDGPVSCNLKISSSSGTFYINYYYCSQKIVLPDFNPHERTLGV